jgi:hypothetical protein
VKEEEEEEEEEELSLFSWPESARELHRPSISIACYGMLHAP